MIAVIAVLFLLITWLLLSLAAAGVGFGLIGRNTLGLMRDSREPESDLLIVAAWLGIALIAMTAFACALFLPLDSLVSTLVLAAAALIGGWGWSRRAQTGFVDKGWMTALAALCVLAIVLAERSTQVGNLEDAGGYHWGLIRWYGESGIPVGLGLFQWRLATHSSWLAFTALLNHGPMMSRVGNVANGLILLWALAHTLIAAARIYRGVAGKADVFFMTAMLLMLPTMLRGEIRLSPSPDVAVLLLCVLIPWAWLRFHGAATTTSFGVVLLLLSAFAVTVKLNAIPLLIAMALIMMWQTWREPVRWWLFATAIAVPIATLIAASFMTTGCALFPSPALCFEVAWGVGAETARQYSEIVNSTAPRNIGGWMAASATAFVAILFRRRSISAADWGVAAIALFGIAFTSYFAPTTRFGLGYFVLLPSLAVACYAPAAGAAVGRFPRGARAALGGLFVLFVAIELAVPLYKEFVYQTLRAREFESLAARKRGDASINELNAYWYLVPNRLAYEGPFVSASGHGFAYEFSPAAVCWDRKPLCASNPELSFIPTIRLRAPERGIGGGFTNRD